MLGLESLYHSIFQTYEILTHEQKVLTDYPVRSILKPEVSDQMAILNSGPQVIRSLTVHQL